MLNRDPALVGNTTFIQPVHANNTQASARFSKGEVVNKPVFANGTRSKGVYTIYDCRSNTRGRFIEYQLKDIYTNRVDGSWTREKDLKRGS
jgi:hypothetical protein